jgi:hypothetical protein
MTKVIHYKQYKTLARDPSPMEIKNYHRSLKRPLDRTGTPARSEPAGWLVLNRGTVLLRSLCRRPMLLAAVALVFSAAAGSASAQMIPGLVAKPDISGFGTVTANVTPNYNYVSGPAVLGYTLGGFYQTRMLIGVEVRGSIQRRVNAQHQESALAGPRVAMHFGSFTPYVSILGGAGNGWRYKDPPIAGVKPPQPVEGLGPQWTILGGVDFRLTHHMGFRLGEISYSKIYLKNWNLTPLNLTAGVVYRIN